MNVLLIISKTKPKHFVYIVSQQCTRVQLVTVTKPSAVFPLWIDSYTTWKRMKTKYNRIQIPKIWEWYKYWAPCNNIMKPMSWLFSHLFSFFFFLNLVCGCTRVKRHRKQRSLRPKISKAQTILFLLEQTQFMRARAQSAWTAEELPDCTTHIGNQG